MPLVNLPRVLFFATILPFAATLATAQHSGGATPPAHKAAEKKDTYCVVSIGDKLQAFTETAAEALKKEKKDAYDKDMAEYNKAKKEAEAAKKAFDMKMPKLEAVEIKKGGFATEELAKAYIADLEKAKAKPKDASSPKHPAPPAKPPAKPGKSGKSK